MLCNFNVILNGALVCALAVLSYKYSVLYQEQFLAKSSDRPSESTQGEDGAHSPEPRRAARTAAADKSDLRQTGSSVWCRGERIDDRQCRFRNLCVDPAKREFIFLHGPETIISGSDFVRQKLPTADLSSVLHHNSLQLTLTDIPAEKVSEIYTKLKTLTQPSLLYYRFKPDNLMHVFHDDLLPLFFTYLELCGGSVVHCPRELQLVFADPWPEGPHAELYGMFTSLPPIILSNQTERALICFKEAYVGPNRQTVWYEYGFLAPQGPMQNSTVTAMDIRRFTDFFVDRFPEITPRTCGDKRLAVLLSRRHTRLILNEDEVVAAIFKESGLPVEVFSLDDHSLVDIISHVRCADLLVGMHGALLVLAMFLRPGAAFIELYPYAIPPNEYTPYETLVHLPAMGIVYNNWVNEDIANTVTHPDWPSELGGIHHLPQSEQQAIEGATVVDPHLCCDNPGWLFRIYQDTVVDIVSFTETLQDTLKEQSKFSPEKYAREVRQIHDAVIFPGQVEHLKCRTTQDDAGVRITWNPPRNLRVVPSNTVSYEIWIQSSNDNDYKMVETNETSRMVRGVPADTYINIWVRCKVDSQRLGVFNWVGCFVDDVKPAGITY